MNNRNPVTAIVIIIEVIVLFIVGIAGDKISERLEIPTTALLIITSLGLIILSIINYSRTYINTSPVLTSSSSNKNFDFKKFIPRTMLSIFPFGIVLGFLTGTITTTLNVQNVYFNAPTWMCSIVDLCGYSMTRSEAAAVLIGVIFIIIFSLLIDGVLGGTLSLGYGISLPAAILTEPSIFSSTYATYLGHISFFSVLEIILIISEPLLRSLRKLVFQQRI